MNTRSIIDQAQALAAAFAEKGKKQVRLPVFSYDDWLIIYNKPDTDKAKQEFRDMARKNWYVIQYLVAKGMEPQPVAVTPLEFTVFAKKTNHSTKTGHDLAHAVGDFVNSDQAKVSPCKHAEFYSDLPENTPCLATITVFGEKTEEPEVMSVVLHRSDGSVLQSLEILANDYSPQQAWQKAMVFIEDNEPLAVMQDDTIRKPEFCSDCNALLVHVASKEDMDAAMEAQTKPRI